MKDATGIVINLDDHVCNMMDESMTGIVVGFTQDGRVWVQWDEFGSEDSAEIPTDICVTYRDADLLACFE